MIRVPAHTVLQWLLHLIISGGTCPAQCPYASTVAFLFLCACATALRSTSPKNFYPVANLHIFSLLPLHPSCHTTCGTHRTASQIASNCWSVTWKALPWRSRYQVCHILTFCSTPTGDPAAEEWSPWSVCSTTCGEGWQTRTRFCVSSSYSTQCSGPLREQRQCNNSAVCPGGLNAPCTQGREGKGDAWRIDCLWYLHCDIFLEGDGFCFLFLLFLP